QVVHAEEAPRLRDDRRVRRPERILDTVDGALTVRRSHDGGIAAPADERETRPIAERQRPSLHEQLSGSRDDDNRRVASGEAGLQLHNREPAWVTARVLRIGLVDD